jgi:chemotaxis protein CheY-P-specific phosphatase CheC
MVIFRPEDIETISRGFLGFSFSKLPGFTQAQELLLSELGNIILNAVISALSNALQRSFLPSAPKCVSGETQYLLEALWSALGEERPNSVVTIMLDLQCDDAITRCEVVAVIPESLELALAAGRRG